MSLNFSVEPMLRNCAVIALPESRSVLLLCSADSNSATDLQRID